MRFLSLIRPPKDRLTRHTLPTDEVEWRRQWHQLQHKHKLSNRSDFWEPQQILTFVCVIILLVALFIIFSR